MIKKIVNGNSNDGHVGCDKGDHSGDHDDSDNNDVNIYVGGGGYGGSHDSCGEKSHDDGSYYSNNKFEIFYIFKIFDLVFSNSYWDFMIEYGFNLNLKYFNPDLLF